MSSNNPLDTQQINPPVVRTLKPPPEIWELVQPVELRQSPPLLTRLRSGASFILATIVAGLVLGLVLGAVTALWKFHRAQTETAGERIQPPQAGLKSAGHAAANPENSAAPLETGAREGKNVGVSDSARSVIQPEDIRVPDNARSVTQREDNSVNDNAGGATARPNKRKASKQAEVQRPDIASSATTKQVRTEPVPTPPRSQVPKTDQQSRVAIGKKDSAESTSEAPTSKATLNPLVIAAPKTTASPKPKVIQWP